MVTQMPPLIYELWAREKGYRNPKHEANGFYMLGRSVDVKFLAGHIEEEREFQNSTMTYAILITEK